MKLSYYNYKFSLEQYDIDSYFKNSSMHKPSWWKNLTLCWNGEKTIKSFFENYGLGYYTGDQPPLTAKVCPSFNSLFSNSLTIKAPSEIYLELTHDRFSYKTVNELIEITYHPKIQAPEYFGEKYQFLKFELPFVIQTSKDTSAIFQNPCLYNHAPYNVCPGIINFKKDKGITLNIIVLFENPKEGEKKVYNIKHGDVLAMMTFSDPLKKIVEDRSIIKQSHQRKTFVGDWIKDSK